MALLCAVHIFSMVLCLVLNVLGYDTWLNLNWIFWRVVIGMVEDLKIF